MPRARSEPERIDAIIRRVLGQTRVREIGRREEVERAWRDAGGGGLEEQTRVLSFRSGVLTVAVRSAALFQELETFRRAELLRAVRDRLPGFPVERLRFRLE